MNKLRLILIIFILIIIGFFVVYGALNIFQGNGLTNNSLSKIPSLNRNNSDPVYSFYNDTDNDGLSDAKEVIYGSNFEKSDTDGDGYLDGDEVRNGYDPTSSGSATLKDRPSRNITIKYFSWVQEKYKIDDPVLQDSLINEFLNLNYTANLNLLNPPTQDLIVNYSNDSDILQKYITELNAIQLPQNFTNYSNLYEKTLIGEEVGINEIVKELNGSIKKLYNMRVPEKALSLHKQYISIMTTLGEIFADLKNTQKDPVLIKLNIKRGQELAILASQLEKEKVELFNND